MLNVIELSFVNPQSLITDFLARWSRFKNNKKYREAAQILKLKKVVPGFKKKELGLGFCIFYFKQYDTYHDTYMKQYSICINDTFFLV